MQVNGNAGFCAGCVFKGNFCGPLERDTRVVASDNYSFRGISSNGADVQFQDRDGMTSATFTLPTADLSTKQGQIVNEQGALLQEVPAGTGLVLGGISAAVKYGLTSRVARCSGPGVVMRSGGLPRPVMEPTCPAINQDVIETMITNAMREQQA